LNPVTPDLKVGIFHLTAGSRKELRFVLNRSFHVQLSVWPIAIVKVNIFVQNLFQLLRCFVKMMVEGFFFLCVKKGLAHGVVIGIARCGKGLFYLQIP